jgi:hypothetical protein
METVDGKRDCHWEHARTAKQSPEKETPILDALDTADA